MKLANANAIIHGAAQLVMWTNAPSRLVMVLPSEDLMVGMPVGVQMVTHLILVHKTVQLASIAPLTHAAQKVSRCHVAPIRLTNVHLVLSRTLVYVATAP